MTQMQQRRATATQWTVANPVLAAGEIGYELDTGKLKVGDGAAQWNVMPYRAEASGVYVTNETSASVTLSEVADVVSTTSTTATIKTAGGATLVVPKLVTGKIDETAIPARLSAASLLAVTTSQTASASVQNNFALLASQGGTL